MPDSPHIDSHHKTIKRKTSHDNGDGLSNERSIKKRKSRSVHREVTRDLNLDLDHGVNVIIGNMDKHLLADYIAQQTKRFLTELSPVELEDLRIPGIFPVRFRHKFTMDLLFTEQHRQRMPSEIQATGPNQDFSKTCPNF